jgi:hypothetical protein
MRALLLLVAMLALAGCGGSAGAHKDANHHQARIVARLTGRAAERVGATACKRLPAGTLPQHASKADKVAALRAYLQSHHPTDSVPAMLEGCRAELHL